MLPTFILIGAEKSGTSWLYDVIGEHPDVFVTDYKEMHYHSSKRRYFETAGVKWYESQFSAGAGAVARGEFSPGYLTDAEVPARIAALTPDVKLVAMLRDPVARAHSNLNMLKRNKLAHGESFTEMLSAQASPQARAQAEHLLHVGRYAEHLRHYLEHFPSEQLGVWLTEDAKRRPEELYREVSRFIGVRDDFLPGDLSPTGGGQGGGVHSRTIYRIHNKVAETLELRGLGGLRRAIKRTGLPELLKSFNRRRVAPVGHEPQSDADRELLRNYYAEDIRELQELIGRDLSAWLGTSPSSSTAG